MSACDCCSEPPLLVAVEVERRSAVVTRTWIETPPVGFGSETDLPRDDTYPAYQRCDFSGSISGTVTWHTVGHNVEHEGCTVTSDASVTAGGNITGWVRIKDPLTGEQEGSGYDGSFNYSSSISGSWTEECIGGEHSCSGTATSTDEPTADLSEGDRNTIRSVPNVSSHGESDGDCSGSFMLTAPSLFLTSGGGISTSLSAADGTWTASTTEDFATSLGEDYAGSLSRDGEWTYSEEYPLSDFRADAQDKLAEATWEPAGIWQAAVGDEPVGSHDLGSYSEGKAGGVVNGIYATSSRFRLRLLAATCKLKVTLQFLFIAEGNDEDDASVSEQEFTLHAAAGSPCLPNGFASFDPNTWEIIGDWHDGPETQTPGEWKIAIKKVEFLTE